MADFTCPNCDFECTGEDGTDSFRAGQQSVLDAVKANLHELAEPSKTERAKMWVSIAALAAAIEARLKEKGQQVQNRIEYDENGELDEIVTDGGAHLERMSTRYWFLECHRKDGTSVALWIEGKILDMEEREK